MATLVQANRNMYSTTIGFGATGHIKGDQSNPVVGPNINEDSQLLATAKGKPEMNYSATSFAGKETFHGDATRTRNS